MYTEYRHLIPRTQRSLLSWGPNTPPGVAEKVHPFERCQTEAKKENELTPSPAADVVAQNLEPSAIEYLLLFKLQTFFSLPPNAINRQIYFSLISLSISQVYPLPSVPLACIPTPALGRCLKAAFPQWLVTLHYSAWFMRPNRVSWEGRRWQPPSFLASTPSFSPGQTLSSTTPWKL